MGEAKALKSSSLISKQIKQLTIEGQLKQEIQTPCCMDRGKNGMGHPP